MEGPSQEEQEVRGCCSSSCSAACIWCRMLLVHGAGPILCCSQRPNSDKPVITLLMQIAYNQAFAQDMLLACLHLISSPLAYGSLLVATVVLHQMAKYEPFVMGMLANFDALPLDRIHNMLKVRAVTKLSAQQLHARTLWPWLACKTCEGMTCEGIKVRLLAVLGASHLAPPVLLSRVQMFASDPPYDKSIEQLGAFMSSMVAAEKIALEGGQYRKR